MDICASRDRGKENFGERKGEGVAHCVNEDIRNEKGESIVSKNDGA